MATYTINWGNKSVNINNLPAVPVRDWDNSITIKFYHRGKYWYRSAFDELGNFTKPRSETQIYINGKYFLQLRWNLTEENEETITKIIKDLYCYGCDMDEVKRLLKFAFYNQKPE